MGSLETAARMLPVMKRLRSDERAESHTHTDTGRRERECETADCQSESLQIESRRRWTQQPTVSQPQLMVTDHLRHLLRHLFLLHLLAAVVVVFPTAQLSSRQRHQLLLNLFYRFCSLSDFFLYSYFFSTSFSLSFIFSSLTSFSSFVPPHRRLLIRFLCTFPKSSFLAFYESANKRFHSSGWPEVKGQSWV